MARRRPSRNPGDYRANLGLVAATDAKTRDQFKRFFLAMATNDGATCAEIVHDTAKSTGPTFDSATFTKAMVQMVDRFAGRRVQEFEVAGQEGD